MMTFSSAPVPSSFIEIEPEQKSQPFSYEKLYSTSFIDSTRQLFLDASKKMGELCIAADKLENLFKIMLKVPLYEKDEKEVSVNILQNEIRTLHTNFLLQNNTHPYLPILKALETTILIIAERKKFYLPEANDEEKRYPLLKQLNLYEEENNERILPNFFIEYLLGRFLDISRKYHENFLLEAELKEIVKSMKEYKTISTFKEKLKDIYSNINRAVKDHPYIPLLNQLLITVNDFLSVSQFSLDIAGDYKKYERRLKNAKCDLAKDAVGLIACGLWAPIGRIANGCGMICEEVPLPRPLPSNPVTTQYWHLWSPVNSVKSFYKDIEKQKDIISDHSAAPLRQSMK